MTEYRKDDIDEPLANAFSGAHVSDELVASTMARVNEIREQEKASKLRVREMNENA